MTNGRDGVAGQPMELTLLYLDGCPHWRVLDARLREALAQLHLPHEITYRRVETAADAETFGMRGSPTLLVDGIDPFAQHGDVAGLACRLYDSPHGKSGAPTADQLRAALREAAT